MAEQFGHFNYSSYLCNRYRTISTPPEVKGRRLRNVKRLTVKG